MDLSICIEAHALGAKRPIYSIDLVKSVGQEVCSSRELHFLAQGTRTWGPDQPLEPVGTLSFAQELWVGRSTASQNNCWSRELRPDPLDKPMVTVETQGQGLLHSIALERGDLPGQAMQVLSPLNLANLEDPILGTQQGQTQAYTFAQAQAFARPLNFHKMVLANPHDRYPAFFYANGLGFIAQGFRDLWFAPAVIKKSVGRSPRDMRGAVKDKIYFSNGLDSQVSFKGAEEGNWLPELNWTAPTLGYSMKAVAQQATEGANPEAGVLVIQAQVPKGGVLTLGMKPGPHFWNPQKLAQGVAPWFAQNLLPGSPVQDARQFTVNCHRIIRKRCTLLDAQGAVLMRSNKKMSILSATPYEVILSLSEGNQQWVFPKTPSSRNIPEWKPGHALEKWEEIFNHGTQISAQGNVSREYREVKNRVRAWLYQIYALARVGQELRYGGHFYIMYFGIEESWPILALAQMGHFEEAKAQARILASSANLAKEGQHHQYRNGIALWVVSEVARLSRDPLFWKEMKPQLEASMRWIDQATAQTERDAPFEALKGLLPRHTYGGDLHQGAVSLYSTLSVWRGVSEFNKSSRAFNEPVLTQLEEKIEAALLRTISTVKLESFLPLALDLNPESGRLINEGPYERLYDDAVGSYWNLFASMALDFGFLKAGDPTRDSLLLTHAMENRGGLWGGIPRFETGLNSAYVIGYFEELARRGARDPRSWMKSQNLFTTFMAQGMDTVGYAIPEVAPFMWERMDNAQGRETYAHLMRQGSWHFSMYDGPLYLNGHMPITEPLAAGAGEGLRMFTRLVLEGLQPNASQEVRRRRPVFLEGITRAEIGPIYTDQGPTWLRVNQSSPY